LLIVDPGKKGEKEVTRCTTHIAGHADPIAAQAHGDGESVAKPLQKRRNGDVIAAAPLRIQRHYQLRAQANMRPHHTLIDCMHADTRRGDMPRRARETGL